MNAADQSHLLDLLAEHVDLIGRMQAAQPRLAYAPYDDGYPRWEQLGDAETADALAAEVAEQGQVLADLAEAAGLNFVTPPGTTLRFFVAP